jgi:predicted nucleic acid-binding protein
VVDTSVRVDYFNSVENPPTDFLQSILDATPILIGDLILAEVLQGFCHDPDFKKVRRISGRFIQVNMVDTALAVQSARNYRLLRQKGITVRKTIDGLIATYCIETEHELSHNDNDFHGYEKYLGLRVVRQ